MTRKLLTLVLLLTAAIVSAKDFVETKGVAYREGEKQCTMDIYSPSPKAVKASKAGAGLPVIIWFHGGGLTGGTRFLPEQLKTDEYIVVAPSYRLLPKVTINECIDDAAAVTAWVIDNIANYGGDSTKVFVSGHSAGGYLTSMIGLEKKWLEHYGKDADKLAGLFPFSGQVITHFAQRDFKGISALTPMVDEYAPLYHVRKEAAPYVIITGDREIELYGRYEENAYMWRIMKLVGHPYTYIYELDGYNHGDMAAPAFHIMKEHIKKILSATK